MNIMDPISRALKSKSFFVGLALNALFYGGLFMWASMGEHSQSAILDNRLSAQSTPIMRADTQNILVNDQHKNPHEGSVKEYGDILDDEPPIIIENPTKNDDAPTDNSDTPALLRDVNDDALPDDNSGNTANIEPNISTAAPAHKPFFTAPAEGLFEQNAQGDFLPVKRKDDGLTPFEAYRADFPLPSAENPVMAIVIDDVGLSNKITQDLHGDLPSAITFLISPYAPDAQDLEKMMRGDGREIWLKLPLETSSFPLDEPGIRGILSRVPTAQNTENMLWALSRFAGYTGVTAYVDNSFSDERSVPTMIAAQSFERGLGFFEINNSAPVLIKDAAQRNNAPYIRNEVNLHDPKWGGTIGEAAELLEKIALSKGYAVGVLQPYPASIEFVNTWIAELESNGIAVVPLSAIYDVIKRKELSLESSMTAPEIQEPAPEEQRAHPPPKTTDQTL